MAERRMFHTTVVESDAFLDLPAQTQALYFHLGMHADDEGFINNPKQICRNMHCSAVQLKSLIEKGFLLEHEGIVVLTHWRVANTLRKDRLKPLQYPNFARLLYIQENGQYTFSQDAKGKNLFEERSTICQPNGNQMPHKVREGKVREDKINKEKIMEDKVAEGKVSDTDSAVSDADATEIYSRLIHTDSNQSVIRLTQAQVRNLVGEMGVDYFAYYVEKLAKFIHEKDANVKSHYTTIRKWWKEDNGL